MTSVTGRSVAMPRHGMLRIDDGRALLVHVREGEIWLTQDGSPADHVLRAGEWFRLDRDGIAILHAFRRSMVTLSAPDPEVPARRIALGYAAGGPARVLFEDGAPGVWRALRRIAAGLIAPIRDGASVPPRGIA